MALWKRNRRDAILRALIDGSEVATVFRSEVPKEIRWNTRLEGEAPVFELIDSGGHAFRYDLSSAAADGDRFASFSVRVGAPLAVEADCLLSPEGYGTEDDFRNGDAKGIRFQPFYLPECEGNPEELVGRGLFFRGLHSAGTITPGNVSLLCVCDHCRGSFRVQSFHAGFGNQAYFYCSDGPHTVIVDDREESAPAALAEPDPAALARLEAKLPPCATCGGSFAYMNPFRCPSCSEPYIDFDRYPEDRIREYYGNYIYGTEPQTLA